MNASFADRRTVLVADDEEDVRFLLSRLLGDVGYEVHLAQDGLEALDLIETSKPDLMILDLMMPGLDGESVLTSLSQHATLKSVPVLVVSGKYDSLEVLRDRIGEDNIFPKPFEPTRMLDRIGDLIGFPDQI